MLAEKGILLVNDFSDNVLRHERVSVFIVIKHDYSKSCGKLSKDVDNSKKCCMKFYYINSYELRAGNIEKPKTKYHTISESETHGRGCQKRHFFPSS